MPQTIAIIQARMTSTRLPGKSLLPLAGVPMLEHVIRRVQRVPGLNEVRVATTNDGSEAPLNSLCERLGVLTYRGSVTDVLSRYVAVAAATNADLIMRITADCPFIDPEVSGRVLEALVKAPGRYSYVSNTLPRTYPRGLDTEVFTRDALETAHREARDPADREHVTRFIYSQPERFALHGVTDSSDNSGLRWTVDTPEDYQFAQAVYERLWPTNKSFTFKEVLGVIARNPELTKINAHVAQRLES
jgi:spore coat polysaccharide biosynthesis protein SpsF